MLRDEQIVFVFIFSLLRIRYLDFIFTDKSKVNQLVSRETKLNPFFFYCKAVLPILLQCYVIYYIGYTIYINPVHIYHYVHYVLTIISIIVLHCSWLMFCLLY